MTKLARFAGIDIGSRKHGVAIVDERGGLLGKARMIAESRAGYDKLFVYLGSPDDLLITMEATGHYWQNLFSTLTGHGYRVAVVNPLRTSRFAGEDLVRAKTDLVDAVSIARFGAQKRPQTREPRTELEEQLQDIVRFRDRLVQDMGDRMRQLQRMLELCFPELLPQLDRLDTDLALKIIERCPTAQHASRAKAGYLAKLVYDGSHCIGRERARRIVEAGHSSIGSKGGPDFEEAIGWCCRDIREFRERIERLNKQIAALVVQHEVGSLLVTIPGIAAQTAAYIIAEAGNPARFRNAAAFCAFVGVTPKPNLSGVRSHKSFKMSRIGSNKLRKALYMPTLVAVRHNPWLKRFYERLVAKGKPKKVAMIAGMHKLLKAVYAVARDRRAFEPRLPPDTAPE